MSIPTRQQQWQQEQEQQKQEYFNDFFFKAMIQRLDSQVFLCNSTGSGFWLGQAFDYI